MHSVRVTRSAARWLGIAIALLAALDGTARADGRWPSLTSPSSVAADGRKDAALVIAIEDYAHLPRIPGARMNGNDWTKFLTEQKQVPAAHVHYVTDAKATRENILAEARSAASEVEPGGTLLVIFIGHGVPANDGTEAVLVGGDAMPSEGSLYARGIAEHELAQVMAGGAGAHRVLVVDATLRGRADGGEPLAPGWTPLALRPVAPTNLTLLTAGDPDEVAGPLPGASRPAFSYLVLGALRGWARADEHGTVTAREALGYARRMLGVLPIHRQQTPSLSGADLDAPLATGGSEQGPEPADFLPPPPPPPPPPVINRDILLPSASPPADAALVDFTGDSSDWTLVNTLERDRQVCVLPCTRWVPLRARLAYVGNDPRGERFPVDLQGVDPGTRIRFGFSSRTLPKVLLVLGGAAVTVGVGALWVYVVNKNITFTDADQGMIWLSIVGPAMIAGGFLLPGGSYLSRDLVSPPNSFDPSRRARAAEAKPRVIFTGNGFAGTF